MAEYLTLKGVPFRRAHVIVGKLVRDCEDKGKKLRDLKVKDLKAYSEAFEKDIIDHINPFTILSTRKTLGAASFEEVERAAEDLRSSWELGSGPLDSLTDLLEERGLKVGSMDADVLFDACTFRSEQDTSVTAVVVRSDMPGDRQRFCLAHELGHLMLRPDGLDDEEAAHRFAAAFLVPRAAALFELRGRRVDLSLYELHLLKHKYGLSMQAWIYRAGDLGIISRTKAETLFKTFSSKGWRKEEPGDVIAPEVPRRFERLVMGSLADGLISESRASELLGMPVRDFLSREAEVHGGWLAEVCD